MHADARPDLRQTGAQVENLKEVLGETFEGNEVQTLLRLERNVPGEFPDAKLLLYSKLRAPTVTYARRQHSIRNEADLKHDGKISYEAGGLWLFPRSSHKLASWQFV